MSVSTKIKSLENILMLSDLALKEPDKDACSLELEQAGVWLDGIIDKHLKDFNGLYLTPHTGTEFWNICKHSGLRSDIGFMSDHPIVIKMKKVLTGFKRSFKKDVPVLFGGKSGKVKTKKKTRSRDSKRNNSKAASARMASKSDDSDGAGKGLA